MNRYVKGTSDELKHICGQLDTIMGCLILVCTRTSLRTLCVEVAHTSPLDLSTNIQAPLSICITLSASSETLHCIIGTSRIECTNRASWKLGRSKGQREKDMFEGRLGYLAMCSYGQGWAASYIDIADGVVVAMEPSRYNWSSPTQGKDRSINSSIIESQQA